MRVYSKKESSWKNNKLYFGEKKTGYEIFPHSEYSEMFLIKTPLGSSEDFYNKTRAREHAYTLFSEDHRKIDQITG